MILDQASKDKVFESLLKLGKQPEARLNMTGLPDEAKPYVLAAFDPQEPVVILVQDELSARRWQDDLDFWRPDLNSAIFSAREIQISEATAIDLAPERRRLVTLTQWLQKAINILIIPAPALLQILPPPELLAKRARRYEVGDLIDPMELREQLAESGYAYATRADSSGEYAARGDIVDFVPEPELGEAEVGVRVSFFDTEIDQIRLFNTDTQRGEEVVDHFVISPLREIMLSGEKREALALTLEKRAQSIRREILKKAGSLEDANAFEALYLRDAERLREDLNFPAIDRYLSLIYPEQTSILDYVSQMNDADSTILLVDEPARVWERMDQATADLSFRAKELWERQATPTEALEAWRNPGEIRRQIDQWKKLWGMSTLLTHRQGFTDAEVLTFMIREADSYRGHEGKLHEDVDERLAQKEAVLLMASSAERVERLKESFPGNKKGLTIVQGSLSGGFDAPRAGLLVLTAKEIFGQERRRRRRRRKDRPGEAIDFYTDLSIGDYVVHDTHGIGIYKGLETLKVGGSKRDYLKLQYAKDDVLYIPIDDLQEVRKYVGAGSEQKPRLSRLGSGDWDRLKSRAKDSIKELATDLVKLYAERQQIEGFAFSKDTSWEREFAANFPFEETDDQLQAIEDVKHDMEQPKVMDRLLCGDVGFGKTEVAFRAMFKAVGDGKQAALLAPTTVLVQQHYENFMERTKEFPLEVRTLSRFVTPSKQKEIIRDLKTGRVDVVIGTHRLLSKEIAFHDLGLLVIDEEQRFGVDHKEMIKDRYPRVDVLTLTATPIPRTLHMSLSGIRDISLIEEPPEDRRPVRTYVLEMDPVLIEEAIRREVDRQGQVFFLFNNTRTIHQMADKLRKAIPGLRVAVAHGQMPQGQLEDVMHDFLAGDYDLLLCTTIIESGIDMPRVNTLIVTHSDRLGLAQLYQLKGRVGRSSRQAYAYFTFEKDKILNENAEKRLTAIREFTELGSGLKIALRDLEVRGAGNILGAEQHGQMEAVGYDLYCRMLDEEIAKAKWEFEAQEAGSEEAAKELKVKKVSSVTDQEEAAEAARSQAELTGRHHPGATIEISIDAWFPPSYIPDEGGRMDLYRRISEIETMEDYRNLYDELLDRFGEPGANQLALLDIAYIKAQVERLGALAVVPKQQDIRIEFGDGKYLNQAAMGLLLTLPAWQQRLTLHAGKEPYILVHQAGGTPLAQLQTLRELFYDLERTIDQDAA